MKNFRKYVRIVVVAAILGQAIEGSSGALTLKVHAATQDTFVAPQTASEFKQEEPTVRPQTQSEVNRQITALMKQRATAQQQGVDEEQAALDFLPEGAKADSFIVSLDADMVAISLPAVLQQANTQSAFPYTNQLFVLKQDEAMPDETFIAQLSAIPGVDLVEKNSFSASDSLDFVPNDSVFKQQYELEQTAMTKMWDYSRGSGVKIGVLDIGFLHAYRFTKEYSQDRLLQLVNYGGDFSCFSSEFQHGTWVMSVAGLAATNNGYLGASVANQSVFQPYMMGSSCDSQGRMRYSQTDFIKVIEHAMKTKVQVMNFSFSGTDYLDSVNRAISNATKQGMVFVASRGNRGTSETLYPACYDNVISVGSINSKNSLSAFSSYGDCKKGNYVVNYGEGITVGGILPDGNPGITKMDGTSFSAPLTAGMLAIVKSTFPDMSFSEIIRMLKATPLDLGSAGVDAKYGHGMLQYTKLLTDISPTPGKIGLTSVYRVYNPNSGEHLFTPNYAEVEVLRKVGWRPEGRSWQASTTKPMLPVYRVYNPNSGDHFYTADTNEFKSLLRQGWRDDKYIIPANKQGLPVYRLYNPRARTGTHHYTLDWNEMEYLRQNGWRYEGIAFYAETL